MIRIKRSGLFLCEVAGAYRYQSSLKKLFGLQASKNCVIEKVATLEPEPWNEVDAYAVKVSVDGYQVGYVPANTAKRLHKHYRNHINAGIKCHFRAVFKKHEYRAVIDIYDEYQDSLRRKLAEGKYPEYLEFTIESKANQQDRSAFMIGDDFDPVAVGSTIKFSPDSASIGKLICCSEIFFVHGKVPEKSGLIISTFMNKFFHPVSVIKHTRNNHITVGVKFPNQTSFAKEDNPLFHREVQHHMTFCDQITKSYRPKKSFCQTAKVDKSIQNLVDLKPGQKLILDTMPSVDDLKQFFDPWKNGMWNGRGIPRSVPSYFSANDSSFVIPLDFEMSGYRKLRRLANNNGSVVCEIKEIWPSEATLYDHRTDREITIPSTQFKEKHIELDQNLKLEFFPENSI